MTNDIAQNEIPKTPRPKLPPVDRSALGIVTETIARLVRRDGELTRRLLALGVDGDDEGQIFDRIADRLAKFDVVVRMMGMPADANLSALQHTAEGNRARMSYAQSVVLMLSEALGTHQMSLPTDTTGLRALIENAVKPNQDLVDKARWFDIVTSALGLDHGTVAAQAMALHAWVDAHRVQAPRKPTKKGAGR